MTSALAALRNGQDVTEQYSSGVAIGVTIMGNAIVPRPTTAGSKTLVGEADIRERISAILIRFPTKSIETATQLTDEGVRLLKNQRRTPSSATLLNLARGRGELGPAIWGAICELCDRPTGFPAAEPEPEPRPRVVTEIIVLDSWKLQDLIEEREREKERQLSTPLRDLFETERRRA